MVALKDYFESDLSKAFLNTNEFAEKTIIDGIEMDVIFDDELLEKRNLNVGEGLIKGELLFHVAKSCFQEAPFIGKRMKINGKRYEIFNLNESMGMYTVTLVGMRS